MKTFTQDCLKAIAHLSKPMQDRIIADVTRYRLTGEMPEKMPAMRLALFKSLIFMLEGSDVACENATDAEAPAQAVPDAENPADQKDDGRTPAPNYVAIDPSGRVTPLYIPNAASLPPDRPVQAFPA